MSNQNHNLTKLILRKMAAGEVTRRKQQAILSSLDAQPSTEGPGCIVKNLLVANNLAESKSCQLWNHSCRKLSSSCAMPVPLCNDTVSSGKVPLDDCAVPTLSPVALF